MRRLALVLLAWGLASHAAPRLVEGRALVPAPPAPVVAPDDSSFAATVARLSEPGGYFDSDNLISNEASYQHVLGAMRARGVRGGAYLGVGPDQNFTYMAQVRPAIAYLIDIRRDNLLQHLWFKALFTLAADRAEYLALMLGRPVPDESVRRGGLDSLLAALDRPADPAAARDAVRRVARAIDGFGVPLTDEDRAAITRIHEAFIREGVALRFTSHGRAPRFFYPTLRDLALERDLDGRPGNYLVRESDFQFLKRLQAADRVIPVVGDLAGDHALRAIGRDAAARGLRVSAFYVSNVEFYLVRQGSFGRFADNAATLPRDTASVIIRSVFGGLYRLEHPQSVPGYFSTQILQSLETFAEEHARSGYRTYRDVVMKHLIPLQ